MSPYEVRGMGGTAIPVPHVSLDFTCDFAGEIEVPLKECTGPVWACKE